MKTKKCKSKIKIEYKRAVIYCRVSSARQVNEGDGLNSQEHRCRQKAKELDLDVARVFSDPAISGSLFERPAMAELMAFMDDHPNELFVVIFDDLKRFARDTQVHFNLKRELVAKRGVRLVCLNFNFENSSTGRFIETVMAAGAQLEREQNAEQVRNKMQARLEAGYWPFCNPPGLKFIKDQIHGMLLAPNEPLAGIYKKAIEMFANFELATIEAVRQQILSQYRIHNINRPLSPNGTDRILKQPLYAGRVGYEPWGIEERLGHHQGFITFETYQAVQERLGNSAKPRLRKDYNEDFVLRNFVLCNNCHKPCTAAWFMGKRKRYPYYLCKNSECQYCRKSIPKAKLEDSFEELVKKLNVKADVREMVVSQVVDVWKRRVDIDQKGKAEIQTQILDLEKSISAFMKRLVSSEASPIIQQYENEVEKLAAQKESLEQKLKRQSYSPSNFVHMSNVVVKHLEKPIKLWENKEFPVKRMFLGMYFSAGLPYDLNTGFQTPEIPLIVKLLTQKHQSKKDLVEMPGVKPGSRANSSDNCSQD